MVNIHVTYDQIEQAAARLKAGKDDLEVTLERLRSEVRELVSTGFTTTRASGAFDLASEEFTNGAKRAVAGLMGMAQFLEQAAQVLRSTDEQLARTIEGSVS